MRDVGVVPIAFMAGFIFCSSRLRGVEGYPVVHANIPELWIDDDTRRGALMSVARKRTADGSGARSPWSARATSTISTPRWPSTP